MAMGARRPAKRLATAAALARRHWVLALQQPHANDTNAAHGRAPSASALFAAYAAQTLALGVMIGFVYVVHAHAKARDVIDPREKQAGKKDGFSNPQTQVGTAVRERLRRLEQQLDAAKR
jgi:hypothetical protein